MLAVESGVDGGGGGGTEGLEGGCQLGWKREWLAKEEGGVTKGFT